MASKLQGTIDFLKEFGLFDVILPFLLIFAITYAILSKSELLGKKKDNLNSVVALVFALLVISTNKIVAAITTAIPNVLLLVVVAFSFLLLVGIFYGEGKFPELGSWRNWFISLMFVGVLVIFLGAWTLDSGNSLLSYLFESLYDNMGSDLVGGIILLLITLGVIKYITHQPKGG
tara:strand:- start:2193 stop:2717 length:525 start_codon:yes stop_codon:yes gene_type:complete